MSLEKTVWLDRGWYPVAIGFVPSEQAWNRTRRLQKVESEWPMTEARHLAHTEILTNHETGESIVLVAVRGERDDPVELMSTLVHESVHVWQFVCHAIGEDSPATEQEAYAVQNIFEGLLQAFVSTVGKDREWRLD